MTSDKAFADTAARGDKTLGYISTYVDSLSDELWLINMSRHNNLELCYEEFVAHETFTTFLKYKAGWKVTPLAYGIATEFAAEDDTRKPGSLISFSAEYDGLEGMGHACGHNLIATASLSAPLAARAAVDKFGLGGKFILFGTPAEEGDGGKIKILDAGAYVGVDLNLMSHPGNKSDNVLVCSAAFKSFKIEYFGKAAHAAAAPSERTNTLDAMVIAYTSISALHQQTRPVDEIQDQISLGGVAPNIIHAYAAGNWSVRSDTRAHLRQLIKKIEACFEAAAIATGATLKMTPEMSYDDQMPNRAFGGGYRKFWNMIGGNIPGEQIDLIEGKGLFPVMRGIGHNPAFAHAAKTEASFKTALKVSKAFTATGTEVLSRKGYLEEIKAEWREGIAKEKAATEAL